MKPSSPFAEDPIERGPYDAETSEDDLWFLPEDEDADGPPLPRADRQPLFDPRDWAAAQADLSGELAAVAGLFGALDERLRRAPEGWRHRLALLEVSELSWWAGDRISAERLALWETLRLEGVQADSQGLSRAGWALRRLVGGPGDLAAILGRQGDEVLDLEDLNASLTGLHPVVRGAVLFHGWRMLGQGGPVREIEAAVLGARAGAGMGRGGAVFVPLAISGFQGGKGGPVIDRLSAWLRGAERASLAALLHLDRLSDWVGRAGVSLADLQGRTPEMLVKVLAEWPVVTAPMAEEITGAGGATVRRNLAEMERRGLIRELTGQGRYRVWTARI